MRTLLRKDEATELLADHFQTFIDIFSQSKNAVNNFINTDMTGGSSYFSPTFKTMLMWHYAVNRSTQVFNDHPEFEPMIINGVYGLMYNDALFIRFKKLTRKLQPSNITTVQSDSLNSQLQIPGFPSKPCIVVVGYVMDETWTDFKSINLVCTKSKKDLHWSHDMLNTDSGENVVELPFDPIEEQVSESLEKLLKIKATKRRKENLDGTNTG